MDEIVVWTLRQSRFTKGSHQMSLTVHTYVLGRHAKEET
jgi:hypothetical protein